MTVQTQIRSVRESAWQKPFSIWNCTVYGHDGQPWLDDNAGMGLLPMAMAMAMDERMSLPPFFLHFSVTIMTLLSDQKNPTCCGRARR